MLALTNTKLRICQWRRVESLGAFSGGPILSPPSLYYKGTLHRQFPLKPPPSPLHPRSTKGYGFKSPNSAMTSIHKIKMKSGTSSTRVYRGRLPDPDRITRREGRQKTCICRGFRRTRDSPSLSLIAVLRNSVCGSVWVSIKVHIKDGFSQSVVGSRGWNDFLKSVFPP